MNNLRFRIVAVGFGLLLLLPTLDQFFCFSGDLENAENRKLARFPSFAPSQVVSFAREFNRYYKENFGLRNALLYAYGSWKYDILQESPLPEKVVVGKNGWFFLGDEYNNVIRQHRGLMPLLPRTVDSITANLVKHQRILAEQGIAMYLLVAPDSHSIYPEYLPEHLSHTKGETRLDVLKKHLATHTHIPLLDVRDTLIKEKKRQPVYYKTDTHWNNCGNLVVCGVLLNRLRQDFPAVSRFDTAHYKITRHQAPGGDLVKLFMFQNRLFDEEVVVTPKKDWMHVRSEVAAEETSSFPAYRLTGPVASKPKLMLLGDSFSDRMMLVLGGYFNQSFFVKGQKMPLASIHREKPDILVIEIVERNLDWLKDV